MPEPAERSHHDRVIQDGGARIPRRLVPGSAGSPAWRKSSYSGYNGNCVEVADLCAGQVGVRDSKANGYGPVLHFDHAQWATFIAAVKMCPFDLH